MTGNSPYFVDWLNVTLPLTDDAWAWLRRRFGAWEPRGFGKRNYTESALLPCGGLVAWHPARPELRIWLELPSRALDALRDAFPEGPRVLLLEALAVGGKVTRIDVARDSFDAEFRPGLLYRAVRRGFFRSRWRRWRRTLHCVYDVSGTHSEELFGDTLYLGKPRESEVFARCYNKASQLLAQAGTHRPKDLPENWVRFEIQFGGKKSAALAEYFAFKSFDPAPIILRYCDFLAPVDRSIDRRYWPRARWWSEFLGVGEFAERNTELEWPKNYRGLEDRWQWLTRSVSGVLALVRETYGDAALFDMIEREGIEKLQKNPEYQRLLKKHADFKPAEVLDEYRAAKQKEAERKEDVASQARDCLGDELPWQSHISTLG